MEEAINVFPKDVSIQGNEELCKLELQITWDFDFIAGSWVVLT